MSQVQPEQYLEVFISHLHRKVEDEISGQLFHWGAMGVCENLQFVQPDVRFNPMIKASHDLRLIAYFSTDIAVQPLIEKIKSHHPTASVTVVKADQKDWLEEWKKGYEAFPLTGDIWVVPSWKPVPEKAKMPIFIDPGMAFGTGTHETTQICSHLIFEYMKQNSCETAFDVGTGTGILAILLSKLGVPQVYCSDIDAECKRVSLENFEKNKTENVFWSDDFSRHEGSWDLIVANIIDGVLCDLKSDFQNRSNPQTHFIFSGILIEREKDFVAQMLKDWPLKVQKRFAMKEWVGYWFSQG
ncbi:50S ribosomal protein L11 methyltransferase [bacterium]|nr:50S ribosomal protein L11 methyltransferase [bacterium]